MLLFVAIQLIIQMGTSLSHWRLNLALQVSQDSASTCFRWSGHFRQSFVKGLFRDNASNFYRNRFIFDRQGAKNKLAQFFWDTVDVVVRASCIPVEVLCRRCQQSLDAVRLISGAQPSNTDIFTTRNTVQTPNSNYAVLF